MLTSGQLHRQQIRGLLCPLAVGATLLLAAVLHGGIYTVTSAGSGGSQDGTGDVMLYAVNRYTGTVVACYMKRCDLVWPR